MKQEEITLTLTREEIDMVLNVLDDKSFEMIHSYNETKIRGGINLVDLQKKIREQVK